MARVPEVGILAISLPCRFLFYSVQNTLKLSRLNNLRISRIPKVIEKILHFILVPLGVKIICRRTMQEIFYTLATPEEYFL
jgi:hypothetical protein